MNRTDLQQLATTRLAEAKALLAAGHPSGAYYLAGYALECAFKACIAGKTKADDFPDRERVNAAYVHSAEKLCKVADLDKQLQIDGNLNPQLLHFWTICKDWSEQSRYNLYSSQRAEDLVTAIEDKQAGVLQWIERFW